VDRKRGTTFVQRMDLKSWLLSGALVTLVLVAVGLSFGRGLLQNERGAYERGAAVAALHYACRGLFPSTGYVERAFSWGDPKTCSDIEKIDAHP
jgi:hypothetical protein